MTESPQQQFNLDELQAEVDAINKEGAALKEQNKKVLDQMAALTAKDKAPPKVGVINIVRVQQKEDQPKTTPCQGGTARVSPREEGSITSLASVSDGTITSTSD